jgi:GntR family transcriptional regulator
VHATIPRYLRVYGSLKGKVEAGDFKQGDFLPAEPELQKLFNVSRTTVRRAVELLAQEGFVSIQQGKGTEVLDFKATQRLQYVTSFSETLRDKGFTVRFRGLTVDSVIAPRRVAAELKVGPDTRLVRVQRVTLANGKPIAVVLNYLLPEIVPGIEKRIAGMTSLYAFLESEYNVRIEAATDCISATAANAEVAARLEVPEASPLLVVRRVTFSRGKPIEVAVLHVVADKYEYCVQSKDRPPRAGWGGQAK